MSRRTAVSLFGLGLFLAIVLSGPRIDASEAYTPSEIGPDVEEWVAHKAAEYDDIVPETAHRLIWAGDAGTATPWSVVYLHGFSGSPAMAFPFVDSLAAALGANAYLPRVTGHGRSGEALAEATLEDWLGDTADAVEIGSRLGDRVLLVGLSNGAALALWAAGHEGLAERVDAVVALSPNVHPADPNAGILLWPWGLSIARAVTGETRSWEPHSEQHGRFSTNSYPIGALAPLMATVRALELQGPEAVRPPVLFLMSELDQVISVAKAESFFERIPGTKALVWMGDVADPNNHVIIGDALSPDGTIPAVRHILAFLNQLPS